MCPIDKNLHNPRRGFAWLVTLVVTLPLLNIVCLTVCSLILKLDLCDSNSVSHHLCVGVINMVVNSLHGLLILMTFPLKLLHMSIKIQCVDLNDVELDTHIFE